ncbi:HK97 family phage prohead protease [Isoptericola sp. NPDC056134]|uniref:HK97 family phage prohead protease n=1 Tax=Isoptericola sp. NPDC056134 TaxID=3345723 RepID=UPI0035EC041E
MKTKNAPVRLKAGPEDGLEEGQFSAYASVFGNEDSYGDVVVPGAFEKTLADWAAKDSEIPLLFGHRMDDPDFNIGHVVSAVEDEKGLLVTAQLDLESPKAAQVYRLLKGRRIDQMSFAYDVIDGGAVKHDEQSVYELRELKLYEVSVVPIGANQETEILAVKAAADALTSGTKAGRVLSAKNESELRKAHDAIGNVLATLGEANEDQEKASGHTAANAEEPSGAKAEEQRVNPSARDLATLKSIELAALSES